MRAKRTWVIVARASLLGLLLAVALSGDDLISAQVWVAAAAVSIVLMLLRDFIAVAAIERARLVPAWSGQKQPAAALEARGLRSIYVLLTNAQRNPRTHSNVLNPRLVDLANHYLPLKHGVDLENHPARAADLLGDVAWLIDSGVSDRTPTQADLRRFLDVILDEQDSVPR